MRQAREKTQSIKKLFSKINSFSSVKTKKCEIFLTYGAVFSMLNINVNTTSSKLFKKKENILMSRSIDLGLQDRSYSDGRQEIYAENISHEKRRIRK